MIRLCEIIGLTANEMAEVTGYFAGVISSSVFIGILMFIAFYSFLDLIETLFQRLFSYIKKRIPNVRKKGDV